ncbi:ABC transporter six-transmembrane domain-containing protein [Nocardioides sp. CER19]|uniref:ABC transporter six-transmembrane domain-containing protein n=1 Tax=Nocardioides sp. CER19 TaxID=3038538 RepID=UPI0024494CE6|nr:ABC transporter six-transmembrane domain-containing protein [Nocardioides sp. CER19]MDH2416166.1 ABC transporter six-transmembrane domain-containing protein [Nocardioides sp. CER19]
MRQMLQGYRARVAFSLLLVLAEAAGQVFLPFAIGVALDDYLAGSWRGLMLFILVGLATAAFATSRRLLDARLFASVYQRAGTDASKPQVGLSEKSARLNMLREVVDFLEYSMPELIVGIGGFVGTLVFLAALSGPVFLGALVMAAVIVAIYAASTRRTVAFNEEYNDEFERQIDVLRRDEVDLTRRHIGILNGWVIRLSDIETVNHAASLCLMVALQVFAIVTSTREGMDEGALLSIVLYVFEFSASASFLPVSWQEYLRLRDILRRLGQAEQE